MGDLDFLAASVSGVCGAVEGGETVRDDLPGCEGDNESFFFAVGIDLRAISDVIMLVRNK